MKTQKQTHKQAQAEARLEEILEKMAEAEVTVEAALWAVQRAATACREAASLASLHTLLARVEGAEEIAKALEAILEIAKAAQTITESLEDRTLAARKAVLVGRAKVKDLVATVQKEGEEE